MTMNAASGKRVPGGALPRSARLASRNTASAAKSIRESFASEIAPGRRRHNAMPAASPMLVMISRARRNARDTAGRVSKLRSADAACSARLAGFQTVRMNTSSGIPTGTVKILDVLRDGRLHFVFCLRLTLDEPQASAFDIHVINRCDVQREELRHEQSTDNREPKRPP